MATLKYWNNEKQNWEVMTVVAGTSFTVSVVDELPSSDISTTTIYMVPSANDDAKDEFDEYIWVGNRFERLGSITAANKAAESIAETVSKDTTSDVIEQSLATEKDIEDIFTN